MHQSTDASRAVNHSIIKMLQSALALHRQGQSEKARTIYLDILRLQPNNPGVVDLLAMLLFQKSNVDDRDTGKLLTTPGQQNNLPTRSEGDSVEVFFKMLDGEANPERSLNDFGLALHQLKLYEEALQSYNKAVACKPDYVAAYFNRGNTLFRLERYEEALQSFLKVIQLRPEYAEAHYNCGTVFFRLKRYEEALSRYDIALFIRPDYQQASARREHLLKELERDRRARAADEKKKGTSSTRADERFRDVFTIKNIFSVPGIVLLLGTFFCLSPWASPSFALLLGLIAAQLFDHPFMHLGHKVSSLLLKTAVVGLGFGINFDNAVKAGADGFFATVVSIGFTFVIGAMLGKVLAVDKKTSYLISTGTAICGGSAIAAVAPVIDAEKNQISVAVGTIFILNSVALLLFPEIGLLLNMTQHQFGLWSAIAIHDTSSVVGAASKYGHEALLIATTVKLARSLWILPLVLLSSFMFKQKVRKLKAPWFIALFIGASLFHTYFPQFHSYTVLVVPLAKSALTLTLFIIGTGLSWSILKSVGNRALIQGFLTWVAVSIVTLIMVMSLPAM